MGIKVIKPLLLGFLSRTYKRGGNRLALSGLVGFSFSEPDVPLSEQELWKKIGPFLPKDGVWDEGVPKDRGEVLLNARCHGPKGQAVPSRRVSVRVGPVAKILDVSGDRVFVRERGFLRPSPPAPFVSMEIDWTHSYGGPGFAPNPVGKGFPGEEPVDPLPLPNIEDPSRPALSPDDRPPPAGLGALGLMWSDRVSRVGRYRPDELGHEPPPLPENSLWTVYNQAPEDQWIPWFWEGGEPFVLEGLHPEQDRQEGRLPRIVVRSLLTMKDGGTVEVPLHPETLWLFPDLELGVVIHRGSTPLASDDAGEVNSVVLAAEDPGERRPVDHYLSVRDRRMSRDNRDLNRFSDTLLLPERLKEDPRARLLDVDYQIATHASPVGEKISKILEAKKETIEQAMAKISTSAQGVSPDRREMLEKKKTELEESFAKLQRDSGKPLGETMKENQSKQMSLDDAKKLAETKIREMIDRIPPEALEKFKMDREALFQKLTQRPEAPPKLSKDVGGSMMAALRERLQKKFEEVESQSPEGLSPKQRAMFEEVMSRMDGLPEKMETPDIKKMATNALTGSLHRFRPPANNPAVAQAAREKVLQGLGGSRAFQNMVLRGGDLSSLDLSGCDFSECDLIGADLTGSNLSGARFSGAWMAHACLASALIDRTDFTAASLGCADLTGVRGKTPVFERAVLTGAVFTSCAIEEGNFSGADLFQMRILRSTLRRCAFPRAKFLHLEKLSYPSPAAGEDLGEEMVFQESDFSGSDFTKGVFMKIRFVECSFSGATLSSASFIECAGQNVLFENAVLHKTTFPLSPGFSRSRFGGADLSRASLRSMDLSGSDFRGAILAETDFSESNLSGARLSGVMAVGARFIKSDLENVDGRGGDFRQALFLKADLRFADFSYGSLYKAGFTEARIDESTRWDHALEGKTVLPLIRPA